MNAFTTGLISKSVEMVDVLATLPNSVDLSIMFSKSEMENVFATLPNTGDLSADPPKASGLNRLEVTQLVRRAPRSCFLLFLQTSTTTKATKMKTEIDRNPTAAPTTL
jgi:hypothetical protein